MKKKMLAVLAIVLTFTFSSVATVDAMSTRDLQRQLNETRYIREVYQRQESAPAEPVTNEVAPPIVPQEPQTNEISIVVNGVPVQVEAPPFIQDGRTLVPIRTVAEALGFEVVWRSEAQRIELMREISVFLTIGDTNAGV